MTLYGKIEVKLPAFDHCPACQKKLKRTIVPDDLWSFICDECRVVCLVQKDKLQFSWHALGSNSMSEEDFERRLRLLAFK